MKKNKLIYNSDDICIIGASGQFPMAGDITEFWDNIANGRDCITRHPEKNTDGYISAYGVLKDSYKFDNKFFDFCQIVSRYVFLIAAVCSSVSSIADFYLNIEHCCALDIRKTAHIDLCAYIIKHFPGVYIP